MTDYAAESAFAYAIKQPRHRGSPASLGRGATIDAKGWPTQDAGLVVLRCITNARGHCVPAGTYAQWFTGQASVGLTVGGTGNMIGQVYDPATNTTNAQVVVYDSGAGTILALSLTTTKRRPTHRAPA